MDLVRSSTYLGMAMWGEGSHNESIDPRVFFIFDTCPCLLKARGIRNVRGVVSQ